MPATWRPNQQFFALENGFWKARQQLGFTIQDIRDIDSPTHPTFKTIRKFTVEKLYTSATYTSSNFMKPFYLDLLKYIQENVQGEFY